jgi:3-oxoacyl-(acyl-carrier-protein) synthase/malonyl CoA-acyl carrier protein transacylase/phosphopantetheinyl transferase
MEPVAIVGMAAVFPGAADLDAYWRNLERGFDAITEVPAQRWDPVYFDPDARAPDRFYCRRGGFVDDVAAIDPIAFGLMPKAAEAAEPDQLLALHVAAAALDDAGVKGGERTGVILGRGGYLTPGMARLSQRVRTPQQLVTTLRELVPELDADTLERVRAAFQARAGELGPETAIGLVPNLAASRIANRLDLRGPAYTVDAACASALVAVDHACRELTSRRCDLVIAGGVHVCHDVTFWSVFTQLGALSHAQAIRPFDRRADGILIGEGAGVVVLERLEDAQRAGHRVYAVIRGAGVSSDGREASAMRPRLEGQLMALHDAWRDAAVDPSGPASVGLIEAHGTGTPTGDEVELRALARHFGATAGARAVVGSVKSMIGHAMPAAGAAGLIKAALAVHHGVLPPTLHCEEPHDELARTRFRVIDRAEPWGELPRRAGVSAFGFGGINAHVVIEGPDAAATRGRAEAASGRAEPAGRGPGGAPRAAAEIVLAIAARTIDELRDRLAGGETGGEGPVRLAIVEPTPERRALAAKVIARGKPWRGQSDVWFSPCGFAHDGGKLAFVLPGIEVAAPPDPDELVRRFELPAPRKPEGTGLEGQGLAVFGLGRVLAAALERLGARPDLIAGHSLGEWTGMVVSEMIPPADADAFVAGLAPGSLEVPDVVFAAIGCSAEGAQAALDGLDAIAVSHDNCPHQSIVCGRTDRVKVAVERLTARGVLCQVLPFKSGFHSPLFAPYLAPHRERLATLALARPRVPLWSATACAPYPDAPDAIRALAVRHLVEPVRFRELVDRLYSNGVRAFVSLGVGSVPSFVGDTLRGQDHLAIAAASEKHGPLAQLARVAASLWVEGWDVATTLDGAVAPIHVGGAAPAIAIASVADPVLAELTATLREAAAASQAVVDAYAKARRAREATTRRTLSVERDPALLDHCFYRQPPGWPEVSDRYPVAPMTMMIGMMLDAARALAPGLVAVAAEEVRAFRWLAVAPPADVEIRARVRDDDPARVDVELAGYARATVCFAARYPAAPAPALAPLANPRPTPITADRLYADRWMFHGPEYSGVVAMGPMGDDGVDGEIATLPAPGALLDCAGQLMGWWVMERERVDRLAMPVRLARLEFFADHPAPGVKVACAVRIRAVEEREVRADLELVANGKVWCRITSWEDRRFDSDEALWKVLQYPERNALAETHGPYVKVVEHWRTAASRELVMRRFLGARERAAHEQVGIRGRRAWLLGRIAIKDAVRLRRWATAPDAPIFPVEVEVTSDAQGRATVAGAHVSVAHKDDVAVAIAAARPVGIDVETIAPRTPGFVAISFTDGELALGAARGADRDEWMARLWTAKEAVAKMRGTGMTDPRALPVTSVDGDTLVVDGVRVHTHRDGAHVVAWTDPE